MKPKEGVEEVNSDTVHESVPHESPEVPPLPLAKFTARRKVTSPVPVEGAVQSTVHVLALEFEWVTSPLTIWALVPGLEKVPVEASKLNPPFVPETPPQTPIEREKTVPGV